MDVASVNTSSSVHRYLIYNLVLTHLLGKQSEILTFQKLVILQLCAKYSGLERNRRWKYLNFVLIEICPC